METQLNNLYYTYIQLAQQPAVAFMREIQLAQRWRPGPGMPLDQALEPTPGLMRGRPGVNVKQLISGKMMGK